MEPEDYGESFAVTVTRVAGRWQVREYDDDFETIATAVAAVRALRSEGPAFALLCVEDDYFVIVRPTPQRVKLLLSDAVAAVEDDFAAAILDEMDAEIPLDATEDDAWAEGDFGILADLGLSEQVLGVIADDDEAWPSEQLVRIAEELDFDSELLDATGLDE
ncbi:tRNA adenosine deaminase-associated protein [Corynebacterium sp. zg-331]|uniref:tRNA adenosine deaminase-associated protein n=1 Tax=unclassified Corynebacterium TaxID=2624378 RepID=UPI00128C0110|nr:MULTISPECIES: tRNA adenosine deaminase-associated protein [unclassified Corynebacterium]MBC3186619.1 tRNA adenosine deaminase-associated protein [Corynebacterium sp. zg-331]MPV53103.1 tRNA adenosine deaminase [Corynebacterium sp. zg331]